MTAQDLDPTAASAAMNVDVWAAKDMLQAVGLRFTRQRAAILGSLSETPEFPTAETVLDRSRRVQASLSLATVYRNLRLLERVGLVCRYDLNERPSLYALRPNAPQGFILDLSCGEVIAIYSPELEDQLRCVARRHGFELAGFRLELHCRPAE